MRSKAIPGRGPFHFHPAKFPRATVHCDRFNHVAGRDGNSGVCRCRFNGPSSGSVRLLLSFGYTGLNSLKVDGGDLGFDAGAN